MMQFRNSQQAQQANALQMQYTMEDRAREAENRKIAAGNALAARAKAQKIAGVYEQGFNPGQTALMTPGIAPGPGVVRKAVEPSYDYTKTALQFLKMGETGKAEELFKLPEARRTAGAEYMEKDAKARVEALKAETENYNTALARVKPVLAQAISIDGLMHYVDVVDADPVLGPLAVKTGGPTEARKEAIRKMAAPKEAGGGGMTVDQIAQRLGGVDGYALKNMDLDLQKKEAEIIKQNADAAKARGEAGGAATGASVEERNRALYAKAMQDPEYVKTAEYAALYNMSFGEKIIEMPDPNDNSKIIFQRVSVPAPKGFPLPTFGQQPNALAPAPVAAQPTNALAMAGRYGGAPSGAPSGAPTLQTSTAMQPNMRADTGEGKLAKVVAPSAAREAQAIAEEFKIEGANTIIDENENVTKLLKEATSGGLQKMGADFVGFATGMGTSGAIANGKLEMLAAKLLFANLPNGSLGGQVSDGDRISIDKLSGQIGNPDLTTDVRLGAWGEVVRIAKKYKDKKAPGTTSAKTTMSADETTQTYANAKEILAKINASSVSQEKKTELINQINKRLIDNGLDPAKAK